MKSDFTRLDALLEAATSPEPVAKVGYFDDGSVHPRSKKSAPYIASINNNGGSVVEGDNEVVIPSRPFLRDGANEAEIPVTDEMVRAYERFQAGKETLVEALEDAGEVLLYYINNTLDEAPSRYVGNAPFTIKQKGFDRPLYETGWLRDQTTIKIEIGGVDG